MKRNIITVAVAVLLSAAINVTPAVAGFSSSSGGSRSFSSSSGGSKSYSSSGGSKSSSSSSGSSKSYSPSKPAVSSSPKSYSTSKGSAAPAPKVMPRIIPPSPKPPKVSVGGTARPPAYIPPSANYARDRTLLMRPQYRTYWVSNNPHFYGDSTSPFFYLWLAGAFDNDSGSRPPLPAANAGQINVEMVPTLLGVIDAEVKSAEGIG